MPLIRDGKGRYRNSPETDHRDAEAAHLRAQGHTYQQIADQLGYCDKGEAWRGVARARQAVLQEPAEALIRTEAAELDRLYAEALAIIEKDHTMVSHGRIVCDDDGQPLLDDGPRLAAIREARQLRESYRKLYGLDAPSKVSVDAEKLGAEIGDLLNAITQGGPDDDSTRP